MSSEYLNTRKRELAEIISDYCAKNNLNITAHSISIHEDNLTLLVKMRDNSDNIHKLFDIRTKKEILKSKLGINDVDADICVRGLRNVTKDRTYMFVEYKKRNHKYPYIFATATGQYYKLSSQHIKLLLSRR